MWEARKRARRGQNVSAFDERPLHPLEIHRRPLARKDFLHVVSVNLDTPHFAFESVGVDHYRISDLKPSGNARSRNDGPESPHREYPVNRQPKRAFRTFRFNLGKKPGQRFFELLQPLAGDRRDGNDLTPLQKSALKELDYVLAHHLQPVRIVDEVGFGENHKPFLYAEAVRKSPCVRESEA